MSKTKLTRRILTGLVLLVGASGAVTVANEVNNAAVNVNKKDVKASVYEKNGHYYVKLTTDKNVTNVVARVTTEDRKEYKLSEENKQYSFVNDHLILNNGPINPFKYDKLDALIEETELKTDVFYKRECFGTVLSKLKLIPADSINIAMIVHIDGLKAINEDEINKLISTWENDNLKLKKH